jgi:hypothetical protein
MNLIYLGTPGLGENIQMIPAWREWQMKGPTPPVALFVYLPEAQANSRLFDDVLPNMVAKPWPIKWARDGAVILDDALMGSINAIASVSPGETTHIRSRQEINIEAAPSGLVVVEPRYACSGTYSVPDGNGVMLTGGPPISTLFALNMDVDSPDQSVCLCSGSNENMRAFAPSVFVTLAKALAKALPPKQLSLFLANERYMLALDQMWPEWRDKVMRTYMDIGTAGSLKNMAKIIGLSKIVISPDTGTAHVALAASMMSPADHKLIFLPTREHEGSVFSVEQSAFYTYARKRDPHCDRMCRGCNPGLKSVPDKYPWSLQCSRSNSVPCLKFDEANIKGLVDITQAHLIALNSGMNCMTPAVL